MGRSSGLLLRIHWLLGWGPWVLSCTALIQVSCWNFDIPANHIQLQFNVFVSNWCIVFLFLQPLLILKQQKCIMQKYCNTTYLQLTLYQFQCSTTEQQFFLPRNVWILPVYLSRQQWTGPRSVSSGTNSTPVLLPCFLSLWQMWNRSPSQPFFNIIADKTKHNIYSWE